MKDMIATTRNEIAKARKSLIFNVDPYNKISPPGFMNQDPDSPLKQLYVDQKLLLNKGRVVWGHIVQANSYLFEKGPEDHPAAVVFSTNPYFDADVKGLEKIAHCLFEQKNSVNPDPELAEFKRIISDEYEMCFNMEIPVSKTNGYKAFYTSTVVIRKHLPNRILSLNWFPYLILPESTNASLIVPSRYWHPALIEKWRKAAISEGRPAETFRFTRDGSPPRD